MLLTQVWGDGGTLTMEIFSCNESWQRVNDSKAWQELYNKSWQKESYKTSKIKVKILTEPDLFFLQDPQYIVNIPSDLGKLFFSTSKSFR